MGLIDAFSSFFPPSLPPTASNIGKERKKDLFSLVTEWNKQPTVRV